MRIELTNKIFGRLTVIGYNSFSRSRCDSMWDCECVCGQKTIVASKHLRQGRIKSCGCLQKEMVSKRFSKHKLVESSEYVSWCGMKYRCYNVGCKSYINYGGRGIAVCERWLQSFENFLEDMGKKPSPIHSIDRINNNGNYEPGNCRWATPPQQGRNVRRNVNITIDNQTKCAADWAKESTVSINLICARKARGWSDYDSVFAPKQTTRRKGIVLY